MFLGKRSLYLFFGSITVFDGNLVLESQENVVLPKKL